MRRLGILSVSLVAVAPLACGGDDGATGPSQPTGTYVGAWTIRTAAQGVTYQVVCAGSVQISSASGGSVSGNFTLGTLQSGSAPPDSAFTCPPATVTGTLSGSLSGTSLSNVTLDTPAPGTDVWDDAIPDECDITQPRTFSGTVSGNQLTLAGSVGVACPGAPPAEVTANFSGTKSS